VPDNHLNSGGVHAAISFIVLDYVWTGLFASGFPDSSVLLNEQAPALLNMQPKTITSFYSIIE
jgi:hypothetical protein